MYEIYDKHADMYDQLVRHEDHEHNVHKALYEIVDFRRKTVIEFGVGTGRLTALFIRDVDRVMAYDRSEHMLKKAARNLQAFAGKISFGTLDNTEIGSLQAQCDIVIEGWSFGHTVSDTDDVEAVAARLVSDCLNLARPGGMVIFLESLGTLTDAPQAPGERMARYFAFLESHGFTRVLIRTDYRFDSLSQAVEVMGFFFGPGMGEKVKQLGSPVIPEFSGMWYKQKK